MTPNEIYALPIETIESGVDALWLLSKHLPEVDDLSYAAYTLESMNTRILAKTVKYFCFDGRRTWQLATVWLDERPVMIIQNAGREGDDHVKRFVTDKMLFIELVQYVRGLLPKPEDDVEEISPDTNDIAFTEFYGNSLHGHFERW